MGGAEFVDGNSQSVGRFGVRQQLENESSGDGFVWRDSDVRLRPFGQPLATAEQPSGDLQMISVGQAGCFACAIFQVEAGIVIAPEGFDRLAEVVQGEGNDQKAIFIIQFLP